MYIVDMILHANTLVAVVGCANDVFGREHAFRLGQAVMILGSVLQQSFKCTISYYIVSEVDTVV